MQRLSGFEAQTSLVLLNDSRYELFSSMPSLILTVMVVAIVPASTVDSDGLGILELILDL